MINWWHWFAIVMGPLTAVTSESIFRAHGGRYSDVMGITLILAIVTNYGVFHVMKTGNSLIS